MPAPIGSAYNPDENFQLQAPSAAPAPGMSLFPEYQQSPAPAYVPPPDVQARSNAFNRVFGWTPDQNTDIQPASTGVADSPDQGASFPAPVGAAGSPGQPFGADQAPFGLTAGASDWAAPGAGLQMPTGAAAPPDAGMGRMDAQQRLSAGLAANASESDYAQRKGLLQAGQARGKAELDQNTEGAKQDTKKYYDQAIDQALQISKQRTAELGALRPVELWQSMDAGKREGLIATMVLGGLLDAATGNNNHPIAMNALKFAMNANKEQNAAREQAAILADKTARGNVDELKAKQAAALVDVEHRSAAQWKQLTDEVDAQIAGMAPGEQRDRAVQNAVKINQAADEQEQKAQQAAANLAAAGVKRQLDQRKLHAGAGGGAGVDPNDPEGRYRGMTANQRFNAQKADSALEAKDLDGNPVGRWANPQIAVKGQKAQAAATNLQDRLTELEGLVRKNGTWDIPGTEAAQTRDNVIQPSVALVGDLGNAGVLNNKERENAETLLKGHMWTSRDAAVAGLEQLRRIVDGSYNRLLQSGIQGKAPMGDSGGVGAAPPTASRPTTGQLPPGAQPVRQKSTGLTGYILNGVFTPTQ